MEVQAEPSPETWIWNALPYAASQLSTTWQMATLPPRSTCSHCGSLNALDQRVPGLPSTAAAAGVPPCSTDEAVAGLFDESKVAACARCGATASWCFSRGEALPADGDQQVLRVAVRDERRLVGEVVIGEAVGQAVDRVVMPELGVVVRRRRP